MDVEQEEELKEREQHIKSQTARHAIMATILGLLAMFIAATTTVLPGEMPYC
jgi:hypothetical protein